MRRPIKLKIGDKFTVNQDLPYFTYGGRLEGVKKGTVLVLREDDNSDDPGFLFPEGDVWYVSFGRLDPYKEAPKKPKPKFRLIRK